MKPGVKVWTREALVAAIKSNEDNRPAAADLVPYMDKHALVGYHTEGKIYDVLVFEEHFVGENLVYWQEKLFLSTWHRCCLGAKRKCSLKNTWAFSPVPIGNELLDNLRRRYVGPEV